MAIFNSYVKLPEGSVFQSHEIPISRFFCSPRVSPNNSQKTPRALEVSNQWLQALGLLEVMQQRDRLQAAVEGLDFFLDPWGYQHSDTMGYQWDNG